MVAEDDFDCAARGLGILFAVTAVWSVWVLHGVADIKTTFVVSGLTSGMVALLSAWRPRGAVRAAFTLLLAVFTLFGAVYMSDSSAPRTLSVEESA